jgi:KaiC/GvpD/RAD55 family RecA-like ATPase
LSKGWSVIPVGLDKKPTITGWKEYQNRLPTEEEVSKWPNSAGMALITGKVSDLVVVDADSEKGVSWCLSNGFNTPLQAVSGRDGVGRHFYFRHPGVPVKTVAGIAEHVDIRGDGGYIIAPPSMHASGRPYRWVNGLGAVPPIFPIDKLPKLCYTPSTGEKITPAIKSESERLSNVEKALKALSQKRVEDYDSWLKVGMALREFGTVGLRLWIDWSKRSPKYDESVLLSKWPTFGATGAVTAGTIIAWAKEDSGGVISNESTPVFIPTSLGLSDHRNKLFSATGRAEFTTGFKLLDKFVWLRRGEITTIAARTGIGKTSIAIKIACELCKQGKRVLFFTTEMSSDTIIERFISVLSGISTSAGKLGDFTDSDRSAIERAYAELESFGDRIQICDKTSPNIRQVRTVAETAKPEVIIFDHIQHIGGATGDARTDISSFIRGLKDVARENDCPILALSQIRRLGKDKQGKEQEPGLTDLKESGTIEEESAHVIILSLLSGEDNDEKIAIVANVAKNRFGPKFKTGLRFNRPTVTFADLEVDDAQS